MNATALNLSNAKPVPHLVSSNTSAQTLSHAEIELAAATSSPFGPQFNFPAPLRNHSLIPTEIIASPARNPSMAICNSLPNSVPQPQYFQPSYGLQNQSMVSQYSQIAPQLQQQVYESPQPQYSQINAGYIPQSAYVTPPFQSAMTAAPPPTYAAMSSATASAAPRGGMTMQSFASRKTVTKPSEVGFLSTLQSQHTEEELQKEFDKKVEAVLQGDIVVSEDFKNWGEHEVAAYLQLEGAAHERTLRLCRVNNIKGSVLKESSIEELFAVLEITSFGLKKLFVKAMKKLGFELPEDLPGYH
ncbi:hypothetical protein BC830DRAFT_929881 [Chytriomyces sp. MP71]|nr:hypothetical protein BC830DRAFT_929881 [Chytriomyces sp. MP71]